MSNNKSRFENEREKSEWRAAKKAEIIDEIRNNKEKMDYFAPYHEKSVDFFIEQYANEKVRVLENGAWFRDWQEKKDLRWTEEAFDRLKEIQQKKLFDLQVRWRAGKVTIDEIKVSEEFTCWEDNILNCPYIDPVDDYDLDIYMQYLASPAFEPEQGPDDRWQDYDEIKKAWLGEGDEYTRSYPAWYDFHNNLSGRSGYLNLPNIRGDKEDHYTTLAHRAEKKKERREKKEAEQSAKEAAQADSAAAMPPAEQQPAALPFLQYYGRNFLQKFVEEYDNEETIKHFRDYHGNSKNYANENDRSEVVYNMLRFLSADAEISPIGDSYNWQVALENCVTGYTRRKIAEAMPAAFEQYNIYLTSGLAFPVAEDWKEDFDATATYFRNRVLNGRRAAGEPEDFEY